jgi:hypothetical protein
MKINVGLWHGSSTTRRLTEVRHPAGLGWQAASLPSEARGFTSLLNHFLKLLTDYRSHLSFTEGNEGSEGVSGPWLSSLSSVKKNP